MERPIIGNYRRAFLLLSAAAFAFWIGLIYVFNRDAVVDRGMNVKTSLSRKGGLDDYLGGAGASGDSISTNAVEMAEQNDERTMFGSDDSAPKIREDLLQPTRDEEITGANEEPVDGKGTDEEQKSGTDSVERWDESNNEPVDSIKTEEGIQLPIRSRNMDEESAGYDLSRDEEDNKQPIEDSRVSDSNGDSIGMDEDVQVRQKSRINVTDKVDGDKKQDEPSRSDHGRGRAEEAVEEEVVVPETDSCEGRYIFVQILPRRFHVDLLKNCKTLSAWTDMCETLSNAGLGPELPSSEKPPSKTGWYSTNQFSLEVIFHNRMKQYKCLTNDSSIATAIYIPYYAGLDVAQYLWHSATYRDVGPKELIKWLRARPEWRRMWGRDHFLVAGRISWDFRRETYNDSDWGTNLLVLPEVKRMTSLVLESTLIPDATDFAIPYPTYFHPASDEEVMDWQNQMRRLKRPYLFSFAGARRPNLPNSIRDEIIDQCQASKNKCKLLECYSRGNTCYRPLNLIRLFQESIFCLQPQGDSYTRRSTFDSILTGCIPVFFHSGSAYDQYKWHLPRNHTKYSVFIPEKEVKKGRVNIEKVLSNIPRRKVEQMQQEVIDLIPKILYADPRSELETFEDAFDLTVDGVLKRIRTLKRDDR